MHFCSKCQNMYYIRIDSNNTNNLVYYCRNCGNEDNMILSENSVVCKISLKKDEQTFEHIVNKYTKLDPTLPRTNKILCPNQNCDTNKKDTPREILSIRYDNINIKYVYMCSTCNTIWKTEDHNK